MVGMWQKQCIEQCLLHSFVFQQSVHPVGQSISGKHMVLNTSLMDLKSEAIIADKTYEWLAAHSIIFWWHNPELI